MGAESRDDVITEKRLTTWEQFHKTEDYWAIWLGALLLIFALILVLAKPPANLEKMDEYRVTMEQEMDRAGFRTIAYFEAESAMNSVRARGEDPMKIIYAYTDRPKSWTSNPLPSIYLSESDAAAKRAAAAEKYAAAQAATPLARAKAEEAEALAAAAGFQDRQLNQQARAAIAEWRSAVDAESKAKAAAETKAYNLIPSLIILMIILGLFFSIGLRFMGAKVRKFLIGFPVIFIIAAIAYLISEQATLKGFGFSYVLWALIIGLLIANTIGTPKWVKPAVQTEYYIKTGLVLLGSGILINKIALIGIPGIFVAWVVTPIVLVCTYWFGQNVIKVPSKELNITVSSDMSVSGVSAAIATAAACRAKKEELTLAIGMSMVFVAVMIFVIPAVANAVGMHHVWAGAWIGGTVDNTGSVVAAGELIGPAAMYTAATIKMIQNIMIGAIAFGVAAYWALKVERERSGVAGQVDLTIGGALGEIWYRFPKFVLGFIGASVVFSILYASAGEGWSQAMLDNGVLSWESRF
ncbi:MAG: putative sulfate exporter family transporter, partial [Candidatus Desulforudis sp.]|nr:putative sulfate exporter family transporter [Desulforudis sp.]